MKCGSKAVRLYQNKTVDGKRKWIPIAWRCTKCGYVYTVVSDTLVYPIGGDDYQEFFKDINAWFKAGFYDYTNSIQPEDFGSKIYYRHFDVGFKPESV